MSSKGAGGSDNSDPNLYEINIDETIGIVNIRLEGFWTIDEAKAFHALHLEAVRACRARFGTAKVLLDCRKMPIQTRDVTSILASPSMYLAKDRVAVVVEGALIALASRRNMQIYPNGVESGTLPSIEEAKRWLEL